MRLLSSLGRALVFRWFKAGLILFFSIPSVGLRRYHALPGELSTVGRTSHHGFHIEVHLHLTLLFDFSCDILFATGYIGCKICTGSWRCCMIQGQDGLFHSQRRSALINNRLEALSTTDITIGYQMQQERPSIQPKDTLILDQPTATATNPFPC